jgi:hypothetical protein
MLQTTARLSGKKRKAWRGAPLHPHCIFNETDSAPLHLYCICNEPRLDAVGFGYPRAARIARHTRSGVAGMSICLIP